MLVYFYKNCSISVFVIFFLFFYYLEYMKQGTVPLGITNGDLTAAVG